MKRFVIFFFLLFIGSYAISQVQYLRYNDKFDHLKPDSIRKVGFQKLKYVPVAKNIAISFGGEIREQFQYYQNINFGDVPPGYKKSSTWQLWQRIMAHANIEVGNRARIFAQMGSTHRFINPNPLTPEIDQNKLSLHQAFTDWYFNMRWMARLGRQELSYGSHRLITFREGPNTRLTFDGAMVKYGTDKRKVDLFALSPVISQEGVSDDQSLKALIAGIYATEELTKTIFVDYYLLHFHSKRRQYNFIGGIENRQTAGFRFYSENKKTNYEVEGTYQFGRFNQLRIHAYSLSADVSYKIYEPKNLLAGFVGNYVSGDRNKDDNQLNTYNLLFSKPQYGLTAPIGATNMIALNPYLKVNPIPKSSVYLGASFMWRQSNKDGTYSPGAVQLRPGPEYNFSTSAKELGTLLVLETTYAFYSNFVLSVDASKFLAGRYVRETGRGKDIFYLSFKLSFKF